MKLLKKILKKLALYTTIISVGTVLVCSPFYYIGKHKPYKPLETVVEIKTMFGTGSGTVVKCEKDSGFYHAYVLTAAHLFHSKRMAPKVIFYNGEMTEEHVGEIILFDTANDIAYVKVKNITHPVKVVRMAKLDSYYEDHKKGTKIQAIGCSLGITPTIKEGLINWTSVEGDHRKFISTNAPIVFGDSGGGIFNEKGELIGVINALLVTRGMPYEHINLITPITRVKQIFDNNYIKFPGYGKISKKDYEIKKLNKQIEVLEKQQKSLISMVDQYETQRQQMNAHIRKLHSELKRVNYRVEQYAKQSIQMHKYIVQLERNIKKLLKELKKGQEALTDE